MPRGNQGWSTAGRAGRKPLPPEKKRRARTLKATDEEWQIISEFARKLKKNGEEKKMTYIIREKQNIMTAGQKRETEFTGTLSEAKKFAEVWRIYEGTQLGIYDEYGEPKAYYDGEWN